MNKQCRSVITGKGFSRRCKDVEGHLVKPLVDHDFKAGDRLLHEAGVFMWDDDGNEIEGEKYEVSQGDEQVVPWLKSNEEISSEEK